MDPSSPYNPQSNGYAESAVKSAKSLVKKSCPGKSVNGSEFMEALIKHRNTPRTDGMSPSERLFGRPMRTILPCHPQVFRKIVQNIIRQADKKTILLRDKAKARHDRGTIKLSTLRVGDVVRVQHHQTKNGIL